MSRRVAERRRGRPPLSETERRTERLGFRAPRRFVVRLRQQARARNLTLSRFLVAALERRQLPPLPPSRLEMELVGQLARIGNNLNQAVHLLHTGRLDPSFRRALADLKAQLDDLRARLLGLPPEGSE
jgi:mobilization protein NikA